MIAWTHDSLVNSAGSLLDRMERYAGLFEKNGKPEHGETIRHWVAEVELLQKTLKDLAGAYDHALFNVPTKRDQAAAEMAIKLLYRIDTDDPQVIGACLQCGRTVFLGEPLNCDTNCPLRGLPRSADPP